MYFEILYIVCKMTNEFKGDSTYIRVIQCTQKSSKNFDYLSICNLCIILYTYTLNVVKILQYIFYSDLVLRMPLMII